MSISGCGFPEVIRGKGIEGSMLLSMSLTDILEDLWERYKSFVRLLEDVMIMWR